MVARRRLLVASQNRRDGCEKHADAPETALASPMMTHGSASAHGHPLRTDTLSTDRFYALALMSHPYAMSFYFQKTREGLLIKSPKNPGR